MKRTEKTANDRAPLCKLCKERHWNREPCRFGKQKRKKTAGAARRNRNVSD